MGILKHWSSGTLLLIALELFGCFVDGASQKKAIYYQRCFGDVFLESIPLASLSTSSCNACDRDIPTGSAEPHASLLFLIPPWSYLLDASNTMHPLVTIATIMYRRGFDVTIYQFRDISCSIRPENMHAAIPEHLPCDQSIHPNATINHALHKLYNVGMCRNRQDKALADEYSGPYDALQYVPPMVKSLKDFLVFPPNQKPDVIIVESTHVAGALQAERIGVPVIMIAGPGEVDRIAETMPVWKGAYHFFENWLESLKRGADLAKMNMIRKAMGLPLYKLPSDYYTRTAISVLIHSDYSLSRKLPPNAEAIRPLVTECVPCWPSTHTNADKVENVTVLIAPLDVDFLTFRNVIRGIVAAKASFQEMYDLYCSDDSPASCRANTLYSELRAVVLQSTSNLNIIPDLLPSYIHVQRRHPVDALSDYPLTVAVISHCDHDSHVHAAMEIPLICIARRGDSRRGVFNGHSRKLHANPTVREIADELVSVVSISHITSPRGRSTIKSKNSAGEVVAKIAGLIKLMNVTGIQEGFSHRNLWDMAMKDDEPALPALELLRSVLWGFIPIFFIVVGWYARLFWGSVKQESQIVAWRRRHRWLAPYTSDIDTAIFHSSIWFNSPDAVHNKMNDGRWKAESDHEHLKNRNGTTHHHSRRKKYVKKR